MIYCDKYTYSPKEALGCYIKCWIDSEDDNIDDIIMKLEAVLIQYNKSILNRIKTSLLSKIINYWTMSFEEAYAYGYLIFKNLQFENKKITAESITDEFNYLMRLYSPGNAVTFICRQHGVEFKDSNT